MRDEEKFIEYLNRLDKPRISKKGLGIYSKYIGDEERARQAFEEDASSGYQPDQQVREYIYEKTRLPDGSYEYVKRKMTDRERYCTSTAFADADCQIKEAVEYSLAGKKPDYVRQLFEWAAENLNFSEKVISSLIEMNGFVELGRAFLWRGFALLQLGRYEDAYNALVQVEPNFIKGKRSLSNIYDYKTMYLLPKALIPLCEYLRNPDEDKMYLAAKGLEDYVNAFNDMGDRFSGLLYYYFLKEKYPEIYNTPLKPVGKKAKAKIEKTPDITLADEETTDVVGVYALKGGWPATFGSVDDLDKYVEKVTGLGDFPSLSGLMDAFTLEDELEPDPFIRECEILLAKQSIDEDLRKKTTSLLNVAKEAKSKGTRFAFIYG